MKFPAKFILGIILTGFFIAILGLWVFSRIHHHTVHQEVVAYINHHTDHHVHIGNFNLSYIRRFPNILLEIDDIIVKNGDQEILSIKETDVVINLQRLRLDSFELKKILVTGLVFNSVIDENGNKPAILNRTDRPYQAGKRHLTIRSHDLEILNSHLFFENRIKGNRAYVTVEKGIFGFEKASGKISLSGDVSGSIDSLISNHNKLFEGVSVQGREAAIVIDQETTVTRISGQEFYAGGIRLYPEIEFRKQDDGQMVSLRIDGENDFDSFFRMVNLHLGIGAEQLNPDAHLKISYVQTGFVNPFKRPYSEIDFDIRNASLANERLPKPVQDIWIKGNINNGEAHDPASGIVSIDTLSARIDESHISAKFIVTDLKDPAIDGWLNADIRLDHLINNETIKGSGKVVAHLKMNGKISELKELHLRKKKGMEGELILDDINLVFPHESVAVKIPSAHIGLENHLIRLDRSRIFINESEITLQASMDELHNAFREHEKINGKIRIDFRSLDLKDFSFGSDTVVRKKNRFLNPRLHLITAVHGEKLITGQTEIEKIALDGIVQPGRITVNDFSFRYRGGHLKGNLLLQNQPGEQGVLTGKIAANFPALNVDELYSRNGKGGKMSLSLPAGTQVDVSVMAGTGMFQGQPFQRLEMDGTIYTNEIKVKKLKTNIRGGQLYLYADARFNADKGVWYLKANGNTRLYHLAADKLLFRNEKTGKNNTGSGIYMPENTDLQLGFQIDTLDYGDLTFYRIHAGVSITKDKLQTDLVTIPMPNGHAEVHLSVRDFLDKDPFFRGEVGLYFDTLKIESVVETITGLHPGKSSPHEKKIFHFPDNVDVTANIRSNVIHFRNLHLEDFQLKSSMSNGMANIDNLHFDYEKGRFDLNGNVSNKEDSLIFGHLLYRTEQFPVHEILRAFDNFGQSNFTHHNTKGNISMESEIYFTLNQKLVPRNNMSYLKMDLAIRDGQLLQNDMIGRALSFVGHHVKEEIHIHDARFKLYYYKKWLVLSNLRVNNSVSNFEIFGTYHQPDSALNVNMQISLTDLFFRSGQKRKIQTDEGIINLDRDLDLYVNLNGNLNHQLFKVRNRKKHQAALKEQVKFINLIEADIRVQEQDFYQQYVLTKGTSELTSSLMNRSNDLED